MTVGVKYAPSESPPSGGLVVNDFIFLPDAPGPTDTTGYWSVYDSSDKYVIYLNKASQGPAIYAAANNQQLIDLYNIFAGSPQIKLGLSLTKVNPSYTGNCIKIRRASNNGETDIGFSNGQLDESSINTFCSGTNCFVTTWYDQFENIGGNAIQTTSSNQPKIYDSVSGVTKVDDLAVIQFGNTIIMGGTFVVNGLSVLSIEIIGRGNGSGFQNSDDGMIRWGESGTWGIVRVVINRNYASVRFGTGEANNDPQSSLPVDQQYNLRTSSWVKNFQDEILTVDDIIYINLNDQLTTIANTVNTYQLNPSDTNCDLRSIIVTKPSEVTAYQAFTYFSGLSECAIVFSKEYQEILYYATSQGWQLPTVRQQFLQNELLTTLISEGIFSQLDTLYVMATNGSQEFSTINWINPGTYNLIAAGATPPTFSSGNGWTSTGAGYMDTQFVFSGSPKLQQTSATVFAFVETALNAATILGHAGTAGADELTLRFINQNGTNTRIMTNTNSASNINFTGTGLKQGYSTGANAQSYYEDGAFLISQTRTSQGPDVLNPVALFRQGTTYAATGLRVSVLGFGANTVSKEQQLSDAINTYMTDRNT